MSALVFLLLTLAVTPLRKITGLNWIIFSRRTLGLYAFFYASLGFLIFFTLDRSLSISSTLSEVIRRKYLMVGITGLVVMVPLAITSTNAMIKRLGGKRWRALHRLAYVAAIAGVVHYYMQVKADVRQPLAFAAVLSLLLGYRLVAFWQANQRQRQPPHPNRRWLYPVTPEMRPPRRSFDSPATLPFDKTSYFFPTWIAVSVTSSKRRAGGKDLFQFQDLGVQLPLQYL